MANPTIEELQNEEQFELIAELNHEQIKEFVIRQLSNGGLLVKSYMIYQVAMIALAAGVLSKAVILLFAKNPEPLYFIIAALLFCFSFLIVIHELLHGLAIKLCGAKKVNYGAYVKKFIFYAEADRHVLNKKQFAFIALTPLVLIKLITVVGILLFHSHPLMYFLLFIMCAHSFFCAGDIGLLTIFTNQSKYELYTFDVKSEKKSYYYRRVNCSD